MHDEHIVVFVTASNEEEGAKIAQTLVQEGLCACCNITAVRSIYKWQGKVSDEKEVLCIIKTRRGLFDKLEKRVKELHSYELPEIIGIKIKEGSREYLKWIDEVTGKL